MNAFFTKNMSRADRVFRFGLAIVFLALAFSGATGSLLALGLGTLAVILIVTSVAGSCPIYSAMGRGNGPRPVT